MSHRPITTHTHRSILLASSWTGACLALSPFTGQATTIINDDFDDGTVNGWVSQGNIRTVSAHNITESGSVLDSEVVPTQTNTHRGIISTTSFNPDAEAGGFSMRFAVDSVQGTPGANGFFIGAVNDDSAFFRDAPLDNFGLTFFGFDGRTGSAAGFGLAFGDNNGVAAADVLLGNSDAQGDVQFTSFADGFVADLAANPIGWSYNITGLNTAGGAGTTFSGAGTWAAAGTDFSTLFGADDSWFAMGSLQVVAATPHTVSYDLINVSTVPEPSTALFLLAGAGAFLLRRRL